MLLLLLSRFSRVRLLATMDFSLPGFSVYGIVQARVLEWVAIAFCTSAKTPYQNQQGLQPQRRVPPTAQVRVPQDRRPYSTPEVTAPLFHFSLLRQQAAPPGGRGRSLRRESGDP